MRTSCRYHWLGSSLFLVSFSTASVIRTLLSPCKKPLREKYSAPPGRQSDDGGLDDLEPLALHVHERPAAYRRREHPWGLRQVSPGATFATRGRLRGGRPPRRSRLRRRRLASRRSPG